MPVNMPSASRRDLLKFVLAGAAVSALPPAASAAAKAAARAAKPADSHFNALLADFADELLRLSPSSATSLGLDTGARAGLKSQLEDVSHAGDARWAAQVKSMAARLDGVDRQALSPQDQIRNDTLRYAGGS